MAPREKQRGGGTVRGRGQVSPAPRSGGELNLLALLYREMLTIRLFEQRLLELFAAGKLAGTTHTCLGQESIAVALAHALTPDDQVFSNHRCHGHYIALTGDLEGLLAEILGLESGVCGGRGGSQHLCRPGFYTSGVQGGLVPCAAGAALAAKLRGGEEISAVFIGDGTLGEGVVYESLNIASLWSLPLLIIVEANQVAQSTPTHRALAGTISGRARAFGVDVIETRAKDVLALVEVAGRAVESVRRQREPLLLAIETYRLGPHSKGDDDRDPREIERHRQTDPLELARRELPAAVLEAAREQANSALDSALARCGIGGRGRDDG